MSQEELVKLEAEIVQLKEEEAFTRDGIIPASEAIDDIVRFTTETEEPLGTWDRNQPAARW